MSFVAPTAYTLELLMLLTDKSLRVTFGVATVLGVVLGSLLHALASRKFRWEGSPRSKTSATRSSAAS